MSRRHAAEVLADELGVKDLVAGRHGRVRREDASMPRRAPAPPSIRQRLVLHEPPDALERHERRVPLVDMIDRGLEAERLEGAKAAEPEDDLLPDAHLAVAAVELAGDARGGARGFRGGWCRGGRAASGPTCTRHIAACTGSPARSTMTVRWLAVFVALAADRHVVPVVVGVVLLLPAVEVEALLEVAFLVEQPDRHERQAEVACGLEVVAGEDAEAARIDGDAFVDAVLHAEVRGEEIASCPGARARTSPGSSGSR